jgi:hypothetical protein
LLDICGELARAIGVLPKTADVKGAIQWAVYIPVDRIADAAGGVLSERAIGGMRRLCATGGSPEIIRAAATADLLHEQRDAGGLCLVAQCAQPLRAHCPRAKSHKSQTVSPAQNGADGNILKEVRALLNPSRRLRPINTTNSQRVKLLRLIQEVRSDRLRRRRGRDTRGTGP